MNRKRHEMEAPSTVVAYEAPAAELGATRLAMHEITIFVVLIVLIVVMGGVALFCIAKGKTLAWSSLGWDKWTIACQ